MSETKEIGGSIETLRAAIDEISTQLVVDGFGESVIIALRALSEAAVEAGLTDMAAEASRLSQACLAALPSDQATQESLVQSGLMRLNEALKLASAKAAAPTTTFNNSLAQDPELVNDFITESREHLSAIEGQMLVLEQNPEAKDAIHAVFRGFHTIKGLAGFLEFGAIQKVAHEVETLLDLARNDKVSVSGRLVDVVLEATDYLKDSLAKIEGELSGGSSAQFQETEPLVERIRNTATAGSEAAPIAAKNQVPEESAQTLFPSSQVPSHTSAETVAAEPVPSPSVAPAPVAVTAPVAAPAPKSTGSGADTSKANESKPGESKPSESFQVRVDTSKLDYLMEAVGELVIAQSIVRHGMEAAGKLDPVLQGSLAQLARITAEVQRSTMGMRMVPIGQLFQRSSRLVRDLSRKLGKTIVLETSGESTEVDKTIAEELADPLLHMVRNAIDHGVETPDERIAAGKEPTAHIRLSAYHKGAQIVVEISDDGKGLDRKRILAKAVEKGLISEGVVLTDSEVFALIFEPGFSTAAQVTDLSGRGVGMDVVRRNLAKLRGQIDIASTQGQGSTFYLRLPLTLAIIEGLIVAVGSQRFIIPVFAVREMVRVTQDMLSTFRGRNEMALIRGQLLPIVRLSEKLGISARSQNLCDGILIIAELDNKQFGFWVDDLVGRQEIVIKSLGDGLKDVPAVAGCAILGDGRVGLILDVAGLCR